MLIRVLEIYDEISRLHDEISNIRSKCSHANLSSKRIEGSVYLVKVCDDCLKVLRDSVAPNPYNNHPSDGQIIECQEDNYD